MKNFIVAIVTILVLSGVVIMGLSDLIGSYETKYEADEAISQIEGYANEWWAVFDSETKIQLSYYGGATIWPDGTINNDGIIISTITNYEVE